MFYQQYCVCCGRYATQLSNVREDVSVDVICPNCIEEMYGDIPELHTVPEYIYTFTEADLSDDLPF